MYVLGDVIDRHPMGIDVLLDIMERPNVIMLLGNHEQMCIEALHWKDFDARRLWHSNGGSETDRELSYRRPEIKEKVLSFLRSLPTCLEIEVNGRKFHLVHGYPAKDNYMQIWNRPDPDAPAPIPGTTVIIGHTATIFLQDYTEEKTPLRIWHGDGIVCIDCGCGNKTELRRLACLRLDDMREFYV